MFLLFTSFSTIFKAFFLIRFFFFFKVNCRKGSKYHDGQKSILRDPSVKSVHGTETFKAAADNGEL